MNTTEMIHRIAAKTGIRISTVKEVVNQSLKEIREALIVTEPVKLRSIGTLRVRGYKGRILNTPLTKGPMKIGPHRRVVIIPSKVLRDTIQEQWIISKKKVKKIKKAAKKTKSTTK